jgi:xylulokinase
MAAQLILAHDLGTTGDKATLFDREGRVAATVFAAYPTSYARPNWAEQDPAHWQKAFFGATRHLLAEANVRADDVAVISFSGHMNGALVVDEAGLPLRPAILWADQRAATQAEFIRRRCGDEEIYRLTGNRISAAYTAAKLLWIKENEPDIYRRTHTVVQAKDYAAFLLTGVLASDYSDASLTQLFDLSRRCWAEPLLDRLNLDPALLPPLYPSAHVIGGVTKAAAEATGLRPDTPVVIGGGDGACATVGAGAVRTGDSYNYLGSSSWLALATARPLLDAQQRTFNLCHLDPGLNVALGAMQAAGAAFDWFGRLLASAGQSEPHYQTLDAAAAHVPAGSRGLIFLPYLLGERSPHWNPLARGAFVGLSMAHGRAEMTRAVMEGVAFNLRHILDILRAQGAEAATLRLIGGGGKSALWRRILAGVYGLPVEQIGLSAQATSLGAAIAGGVGVGIFADYTVARSLAPITSHQPPDPDLQACYQAIYPLFKETYLALEPIFDRLAELTP